MAAEPKAARGRDANTSDRGERAYREHALDEALNDTFPASDPVSVEQPKPPAADKAVFKKAV
jgi:hypothetical protein